MPWRPKRRAKPLDRHVYMKIRTTPGLPPGDASTREAAERLRAARVEVKFVSRGRWMVGGSLMSSRRMIALARIGKP